MATLDSIAEQLKKLQKTADANGRKLDEHDARELKREVEALSGRLLWWSKYRVI
jgi:hypothetical protein